MRDFYDREHWEQLIGTIIDRLGIEGFFEAIAYVLHQRGPEHLILATALLRQMAQEAGDAD